MPNWRKELRELITRDPALGEANVIVDALREVESDRGCALIAGSIAEDTLQEILKTKLVPLSNERVEELFGVNGIIGSFSSKIRIAFAFRIIDAKVRDDYDRVREIRNVFAHARTPVYFNTPAIARSCKEFHSQLPPRFMIAQNTEPRQRYIQAVYTLITASNIAMKRKKLGHVRRLAQPISFDEAETWRNRFLLR
jgi:hypothetical protein